jgi:hypothetical protein
VAVVGETVVVYVLSVDSVMIWGEGGVAWVGVCDDGLFWLRHRSYSTKVQQLYVRYGGGRRFDDSDSDDRNGRQITQHTAQKNNGQGNKSKEDIKKRMYWEITSIVAAQVKKEGKEVG